VTDLLTVDSNVLVYSQDNRDARKHGIALDIVAKLQSSTCLLTTITLGEFFHTVSRKFLPVDAARRRLEDFITLVPMVEYNAWHLLAAAAVADAGRFSFWDAVMLASASEAGATICLSEDMGDGARFANLTVRNPFGPRGLTPDIRALLRP
jgi:predicted nucleic acid-binding protein